jgi:hypothetical protein
MLPRRPPCLSRAGLLAAVLSTPLACAGSSSDGAAPSSTASGRPPIGIATMLPDGTLVLDLTTRAGGMIGHAHFTYAPSDPKYDATLRHIGGLRPGEHKNVPPWPDSIDDAAVEATVRAYITEKKGWKQDKVSVEATGTYDDGDVAATAIYSGDGAGKPVYLHVRVDQKARKVVKEFP